MNYYTKELEQFRLFNELLEKEREFSTLSRILENINTNDDLKVFFNERLEEAKKDIIELKNSIDIFNI